jgi:hypothetical protein
MRTTTRRHRTVPTILVAGLAWAYWSTDSVDGGNGASGAASVNQGATPTVSAVGPTATVSWAARTLSTGGAVAGYLVKRYDAGTLAPQTILSACTGTITALTCVESTVPDGSWKYTVTPVFATNWQGVESATSATISTDGITPTNAVTLSSVSGGAALSGTTVYYRGVAAGSLRVTNAVTDAGSGPASSSTAAPTGTTTGWSHTPSMVSTPAGGPYVSNAFDWTAGTTSGPGEAVTGRDVAGNSAVTNLTFADDSTAPTAGTITYADGFSAGRSVSMSFTTGTDSGSGIATRQLQRANSTLDGLACATFGNFNDIGADSPGSPYVDGSLLHGCYMYRYVVTDRVGNRHIATSASVVKVSYAGAVNTTPGLLSHWPLGEASSSLTSSDSFNKTTGNSLNGTTADSGGTWTFEAGTTSTAEKFDSAGRVYRDGTSFSVHNTTATPPTANYSVETDLYVQTNLAGDMVGVIGRLDAPNNDYYLARWEPSDTSWNIMQVDNGTASYVTNGYVTGQPALVAGQTYRMRLEMIGTTSPATLNLYVNGVLKVTTTDSVAPVFTANGTAGIVDGNLSASILKTSTTGIHLDNFQVTPSTYPRAADNKGTNIGDYKNGVTLGAPGALAAGTNTAATFDGVNDHVQMTGTTGIPVGASTRSVEAWFKTSSATRQVIFSYGSRANAQEFGLWIDAGGATMQAWGFGPGNDIVFTMPAAVNNGAWHQVVLTYSGTTLTLYIDGVALATQAATRATVMDQYGFGIGAIINPSDGNSGGFFNGSIDEVSFYTTVLDQTTVTNHYQLAGTTFVDGTGPTGGSIDATALTGTGSRYATSTTLSLALVKGTDLSGVATTGNQVLRATATLTGGSCGTYGSYTLITGGTDPVSPKADTVTDQACYSYQYVVLDTQGNATTYPSPDIKVDLTAPAAPTLAFSAFTNTYWPGSGTTVYYRSAATPGSFTATGTATDSVSGIASYAFPALGTNWTSTPGALGVNVYSWSGAPAAPGTKNVTATNNATGTSTNSPFTMTADDTAPTAGTVTYASVTQSTTTISVGFTAGTDAASGIGSRLLQRASATLTGTTCGTYSGFATISGGTNPGSSPVSDTVTAGSCYQYQYVVSDNVGNAQTATSANVVKVSQSYFNLTSGTSSLVNYWRLGENALASDTMTGTAGVTLDSRSSGFGTTWTKHAISTGDAVLTPAGRVRKTGTNGGALYYATAVPASADYTVEADIFVASEVTNDIAGVVGRVSTGAQTFYVARYEQSTHQWWLHKVVNGTWSGLGSAAQTIAVSSTYRLALDMTGTNIRVLVDGVQVISVTDAGITSAGRGGVAMGYHATASTTLTDSTGYHIDNFGISPPLADSKGTNHGDYFGGVATGQTGAISGDANSAALFDGTNDFGSVSRTIQDDFSIEFWFKSSQSAGSSCTQWWDGMRLVDAEVNGSNSDFGVSLCQGKIIGGVGSNSDVSIVTPGTYNNNTWHHVVFTRTMSPAAMQLYVDGALVIAGTPNNTGSLTASTTLAFGRAPSGGFYYSGLLDEIAVYSTVLPAATISAHYAAR